MASFFESLFVKGFGCILSDSIDDNRADMRVRFCMNNPAVFTAIYGEDKCAAGSPFRGCSNMISTNPITVTPVSTRKRVW